MKRIMVLATLPVLLTIGLWGCGEGEPSGPPVIPTVQDKSIDPAHTEIKRERYCKIRKTNGTCRTYDYKNKVETDDKDWLLHLSNGEVADVDEDVYNDIEIGDPYDGPLD